jgi:hypothetical protein
MLPSSYEGETLALEETTDTSLCSSSTLSRLSESLLPSRIVECGVMLNLQGDYFTGAGSLGQASRIPKP